MKFSAVVPSVLVGLTSLALTVGTAQAAEPMSTPATTMVTTQAPTQGSSYFQLPDGMQANVYAGYNHMVYHIDAQLGQREATSVPLNGVKLGANLLYTVGEAYNATFKVGGATNLYYHLSDYTPGKAKFLTNLRVHNLAYELQLVGEYEYHLDTSDSFIARAGVGYMGSSMKFTHTTLPDLHAHNSGVVGSLYLGYQMAHAYNFGVEMFYGHNTISFDKKFNAYDYKGQVYGASLLVGYHF